MIYTDGQKFVSNVSIEELDEFARKNRIGLEYAHRGDYAWYEIPGSVALQRVLRSGASMVHPIFLVNRAFRDALDVMEGHREL